MSDAKSNKVRSKGVRSIDYDFIFQRSLIISPIVCR